MPEFLIGVEPYLQPQPVKNAGGDCFACALTAALRYLLPEGAPSFEQVWEYFVTTYHNSDRKGLRNHWGGQQEAVFKAQGDGYPLDIKADMVRPEWSPEIWSHPWWQFIDEGGYTRRLEEHLRAGYVAIAEINFAGDGPLTTDLKLNTVDHIVLLDGVRTELEERTGETTRWWVETHYIHVVCSAKGAYWIKARDLLLKHGAAAWWLVRRKEAE